MTAPLERTVNPQDLDPQTVKLLPYPFAKAKGVLAARIVPGEGPNRTAALEVWIKPYPQQATLAEVRRMAGRALKEVLLTPEEFEHCLALAYTREPSAAETIVEDIGESVDLAKLTEQLPEIADLLEAENDAPIIRLINALLTQAVRESTIPTGSGERVVLRLLDKQAGRLTLDALGMAPAARDAIDETIHSPH